MSLRRSSSTVRPLRHRREHGAVAITVALSLAVLIGFLGLALDLGKLYVAKTELQNAADACALASAQALTGVSANQLDLAEAAGITTGEVNRVRFQAEAVELDTDQDVTFSEALSGPYFAKTSFDATTAAKIKFVKCSVEETGIANWFIQTLNVLPGVTIGDQTVRAAAVATVAPSRTTCALPVAMCAADITNPDGTAKPKGTWLEGALGPSSGLTGSFKWVDFTPPAGGASELGAILTGAGTCDLPTAGTEVGQTGVIASMANDWNTRFGIYAGNVNEADAARDFTGYSYTEVNWTAQFNAYGGASAPTPTAASPINYREARQTFETYQGNSETGLNINGTIKPKCNPTYPGANCGDRRLAITPVVDCGTLETSNTAPVQTWACVFMLHPLNQGQGGGNNSTTTTGSARMWLEFQGLANELGNPCATFGAPGGENSAGPLVPVLVQ
jgi:hypothetical protein